MRSINKLHTIRLTVDDDKGTGSLPLLILAISIAVCAGALIVVRAHNKANPEARASSAASTTTLTPKPLQGPAREAVRFVRFNLYDQAIIPREFHVSEGLAAICIEDYSGGTTGMVVERLGGSAPVRIGVVERTGPEWRGQQEMRLTVGSYKVYMSDRPDNHALLVVD